MRDTFFETFDYLINLFLDYEDEEKILVMDLVLENQPSYWVMNIVNFESDELDIVANIIEKIQNGEKKYLDQYLYLKNYFIRVKRKFKDEHECRRNWRYKCPELYSNLYDIEMEIMDVALTGLIELMEMPPLELFQIIMPDEIIGLRSLCRQKSIPYDVERYISGFIGV